MSESQERYYGELPHAPTLFIVREMDIARFQQQLMWSEPRFAYQAQREVEESS